MRAVLIALWLTAASSGQASVPASDSTDFVPQGLTEKINASKVVAKVPRKLRTIFPFWGCPEPCGADAEWPAAEYFGKGVLAAEDSGTGVPSKTGGSHGTPVIKEDSVSVWSENPYTGIPDWVSWNVDLASVGVERDRFLRHVPERAVRIDRKVWVDIINECSRWAWAKPYGTTNVVCGPLFDTRGRTTLEKGELPYAFFLVICKRMDSKSFFATGFRTVGFLIPNRAGTAPGIYDLSRTVNNIEHFSGYNFFPKLPSSVQEIVEEMTTYELFCPFQEFENQLYEEDEVIFGTEPDEQIDYMLEAM